MHCNLSLSNPRRGSALVVAIIISAVIGISLVSYINLSLNSLKLADRTFYANAAVNLTEIGLEEALYRYNQLDSYDAPADAWSGWSISGTAARRTFSGFSSGPNVTGEVKVYCEKFAPAPTETTYVVAEATISPPQGPPVKKLVRINIRQRSIFGSGMTARNDVSLYGNSSADSYKSDPDGDPLTPAVQYSSAARRDQVLVASPSGATYALDVSGSGVEVYGRVATGGGSLKTSSWTTIQNADSPGTPLIDPGLVTTDFSATFFDVFAPTPVVVNLVSSDVNATTSFPRPGDAADSDGRYYYDFESGSEISLPNLSAITITDDVTWILDNHNGATAVGFSNTNILEIAPTGSLEIYTNGNINISNGGLVNPTMEPGRCLIYGTNSTMGGQEIIFNNANKANVGIYAPNADVTANASVSLSGAIVANTIKLNNNAAFHRDESLENTGGNPFQLSEWLEVKAASAREAYASVLSF